MTAKRKTFNEEFAKFFETPSREGLRELLKNNFGELPNLDFKEEWPVLSKFAKHILGLANYGGGCVIVGVGEEPDKSLEPKGIPSFLDKADVVKGVNKFLSDSLIENIEILDFSYDAAEYPKLIGKKFQAVFVEDDPKHLPFVSMAEGDGIRANAIYTRRGASTEEANHDELQSIINRRLETGYSSKKEIDLQTHLAQLKILFGEVSQFHILVKSGGSSLMSTISTLATSSMSSVFGERVKVPNPAYPKEHYEAFIVRMIERKKKRIEAELDVMSLPSDEF
jgi:hypothetical protein